MVGRESWRPSNPTLLQGHLERVTQEHIQVGFECLQIEKICKLLGQPVPSPLTLSYKAVLPQAELELVFKFLVTAPPPVSGHH